MNDPVLVRGFERLGNLLRNRKRLVERDGPLSDSVGERRALDELHHERRLTVAVLQTMNLRDVRMVQRREDMCLALKAGETVWIACKRARKDFQRDVSIELGVTRPVHFAHPADTYGGDDFVRPMPVPGTWDMMTSVYYG